MNAYWAAIAMRITRPTWLRSLPFQFESARQRRTVRRRYKSLDGLVQFRRSVTLDSKLMRRRQHIASLAYTWHLRRSSL